MVERLLDVAALRLREMDEAGIDLQVLSHTAPSVQKLDPEIGVRLARVANDRLYEAVRAHPRASPASPRCPRPIRKRPPTSWNGPSPSSASRARWCTASRNNRFLDDKMFWPIFERAQALDVPLYMHPAIPHPAVIDAYYKDYAKEWPMLLRAGWGFTAETALAAIRVVLSGVLDEYPKTRSSSAISAKGFRSSSGASRIRSRARDAT